MTEQENNYIDGEFNKLKPSNEYGYAIVIKSIEGTKTNHLSINGKQLLMIKELLKK